MTLSEDIVKACRQANFSPAVTETLLRLHHQQVEMEKAINSLRTLQLKMAQVLEMQSSFASTFSTALQELSTHTGYQPDEQVSAQEIGRNE